MRNKLFFLIIFLLTTNLIYACSCESKYNFSKVALESSLVVLVKINKYLTFDDIYGEKTPMSMEIEIIETLKGKTKNKKVVVWGDNGLLCRPYLSEFKEGEYYFLALYSGEENYGHKEEKSTDYSISICGEFWLQADINTKMAKSDFKNKTKNIPFKNIYSYFK